jgi:hypothetical protein
MVRRIKTALFWCLLNVFFGLFQLWWTIGISSFNAKFHYDFKTLIQNCSLMFFSMALVSTLAIEFFYRAEQEQLSLQQIGFRYVLFPLFIILITLMLFTACQFGTPDFQLVYQTQLVILTMSVVYAFSIKFRRASISSQQGD